MFVLFWKHFIFWITFIDKIAHTSHSPSKYNEYLPKTVSTLGHVRLLYHFKANGTEILKKTM